MAIPQSRYVSITSGTAGQSAIGERDLNGLLFTYGKGWINPDPFDPDKLLICYSMSDVLKYFSSGSDEAAFATKYFAYISPSGTTPASLTFAKMKVQDSSGNNLVYKSGAWYTPGTQATGSISVSGDPFGVGDTLTVGSVTYTFTEGTPTAVNQIQIVLGSGSGTVDYNDTAANIAAVINGTGGFSGQTANTDVTANTGADGRVNLTAIAYGTSGNSIALDFNSPSSSGSITVISEMSGGSSEGTLVANPVMESAADSLARVDGGTNNFGSFAFIDDINDDASEDSEGDDYDEIAQIAAMNAGFNYKYLFSVGKKVGANNGIANTTALAGAIGATNGTALTQGADKFAAAIPMAIFASTDYDGTGTATNYMFKQVSGEQPSVFTSQTADTLDGINVNYYGQTQANGRQLSFYQRGVNLDGQDTAVYCNEVWLQSAIATEIMNLLISVERVPANEDGESMLNSTISAVAQRAVGNGVFEIGKTYTSAQRAAIFQLTGDKDAVTTMQNSGYWLNVVIEEDGGQYKARYLLVYGKGDSVRKVEGRDILI